MTDQRSNATSPAAAIDTRMTRRTALAGAAALGFGAVAFGTARRASAQDVAEIIVGTSQETVIFNPLTYTNTGPDTLPEVLLFDSLMKLGPDGAYTPNLAAEVPTAENGGISADGLTWTFKLRNDVTWHDGQPFTSRDVQFTWETIMNPNAAVRSRTGHDKITAVETPDEYTVVMSLGEPFAPFQSLWIGGVTSIIPAHILEGVADFNTAPFNSESPIGTGPYKFVEHVGGDHLTVEANPNYHLGAPQIQRIIVKLVPEVALLFTQLKNGEIDVIDYQGILAERWEEALALEEITTVLKPSNFVEFIYFNNSLPQFQDKRVKKAIYHAIDRQTIMDVIYYGLVEPTETYLPASHWAYNPDVQTYTYDLEAAKALLDEAGFVPGDGGVRANGDVRLAFSMSTSAGNAARESAEQILQQAFEEIGIEMTIDNRPPSTLWSEDVPAGKFDTLMVAWDNAIPSDPDPTSRLHSTMIPVETGSGANYVQFKNADADRLMDEAVRETDQAKRAELYKQLQVILAEELPWAPLFNYLDRFAYTKRLQGYRPNPYLSTNFDNAAEWTLSAE